MTATSPQAAELLCQCKICFMHRPPQDMLTLPCKHLYCQQCIATWVSVSVLDGNVHHIRCPYPPCKHILSPQFVQSIAPETVWHRFLRFSQIQQVDNDPNAKWCPQCTDQPVYRRRVCLFPTNTADCTQCECIWCFRCLKPAHSGSCQIESLPQEFCSWRNGKLVKRCPRCDRFVHKQNGCNHMTCVCGYEWCWICGGKYSKYHYKAYNLLGCPGMHFLAVRGIRNNTSCSRILCRIMLTICLLIMMLLLLMFQVFVAIPIALLIVCLAHVCFICLERYYDSLIALSIRIGSWFCSMMRNPPEIYDLGVLDGLV